VATPETDLDTRRLARVSLVVGVITLALAAAATYFGYQAVKRSEAIAKQQSETFQRIETIAKRQAHMELLREFESPHMVGARSRVSAALINKTAFMPKDAETILGYFEKAGQLSRIKMLDEELIWNDLSVAVRCYWYGLGSYARNKRSVKRDPTLYDETEKLEQAMKVREARHRRIPVTEVILTPEGMRDFLTSETKLHDVLQPRKR
jgi:hypothetical protein